jgi:hypothetical protein
MTEESPDRAPISSELRKAFWGAIGLYGDWGRGQPEPTVSLNQKQVTISAVCDIVECFDDEMPEFIWLPLVCSLGSFGEMPADRTYRSGARHLAKLISWRKEHFAYFDNLDRP